MKKLLLAGTAIVGAAVLATPAQADLKLDLGGHFRGYAVFADNDEVVTSTTDSSLREFEFKRDFEVHFSGETTTDSGLTVGVHAEFDLGNESADGSVPTAIPNTWTNNTDNDPNQLDEAYIYFSGGWGRVNFGSEDGAAYLLQVAAPSGDSNVDGMRVYVTGLNFDAFDNGSVDGSLLAGAGSSQIGFNNNRVLGYDNAFFRDTDRLTYLTPKWNGFQAGVSYAPNAGQGIVNGALNGMSYDTDSIDFEDLWEIAARWDGEFEGFGISVGAGYSTADPENSVALGAGNFGTDDVTVWDVGLTVSWNDFSLGGAYVKHEETGATTVALGADDEIETWVIGAAWDNGPYHLGASYYSSEYDGNALGMGGAAGSEIDIDRWTIGGGYTYGPGMTFRGAVSMGEADSTVSGAPTSNDFTQVTIGTDVNF